MSILNDAIDKHLNKDLSGFNGNQILVYKGFSVDCLTRISSKVRPLIPLEEWISNGQLDLGVIKEGAAQLVPAILAQKSGLSFITYEQFVVLARSIDLALFAGGEFVVVLNDMVSAYPYQGNTPFVDIDQIVNANNHAECDEVFAYFYSFSFVLENISFIEYAEPDRVYESTNVKTHELFGLSRSGPISFEDAVIEDQVPVSDCVVSLKNFDDDFLFLRHQVLFGNFTPSLIVLRDALLGSDLNGEVFFRWVAVLRQAGQEVAVKILKKVTPAHRPEIKEVLSKYWHSDDFRSLQFYEDPDLSNQKREVSQGQIIEDVILQVEKGQTGEHPPEDIFLTSPTGSGKSVLFQIPAIYIAEKYKLVTIVISPLKALMYDQVMSLRKKGYAEVAYINSDISFVEREQIVEGFQSGTYSILYLSPELLMSFNIKKFIGDRKIGLIVVDEAHLVTTWGRDFRIDYWYLGTYLRNLRKYSGLMFPLLALTATAVYRGNNDIVFETISSLQMRNPKLQLGNVRRDEVTFKVKNSAPVGNHDNWKLNQTADFARKCIKNGQKAIFYFPWINQINDVRDLLRGDVENRVGVFYSQVDKFDKEAVVRGFQSGEILVMFATKAFGMGIDISDINLVYHHAPSGNISDYVQEIGRVARDRSIKGIAAVDFTEKDLKYSKILYGLSSLKQFQVKLVLEKLWQIYSTVKSQNFLISPDEFGYIFNDELEKVDSKVKSALMLAEKDFLKKYNYNVILVRPKTLYSRVFAMIPKDCLVKVYGKYRGGIKLVCKADDNKTVVKSSDPKVKPHITLDPGDIYEIDLEVLWKKFWPSESFPAVKKKFFDKTLFGENLSDVTPKYKITLQIRETPAETIRKIDFYFDQLDRALSSLGDVFFTKEDLKASLKDMKGTMRARIADVFINLYVSDSKFKNSVSSRKGTFIQQKRTESGDDSYRIVDREYMTVRHQMRRLFFALDFINGTYERYVSADGERARQLIRLCCMLEALDLGTYRVETGLLPRLFVRINNPYILRRAITGPKYQNELLDDIDRRHDLSHKTMAEFFTKDMSTPERWDFIERHFLGHEE